MTKKITLKENKLVLNDNQEQKFPILTIVIIVLIVQAFDIILDEIKMPNIIWLSIIGITLFIATFTLYKKSFKNEFLFTDIYSIRIKKDIYNNYIIRIINKKGKKRHINLMEEHLEIKELINFCKQNNVHIYTKKGLIDYLQPENQQIY